MSINLVGNDPTTDQKYAEAQIKEMERRSTAYAWFGVVLMFIAIGTFCALPALIIAAYRWAL